MWRRWGCTSEFPFGLYWWTLKSPKNKIFEKMKKIAGDNIILAMCTKNHNHMRYSSWNMEWDKKCFVILGHFLPFNPPTPSPNNPENKNFKKMKKTSGDVTILSLCNKKHDQMMYAHSDMECGRHKIWKKPYLTNNCRYYPFAHVHQIKIIWCMVPEI